MQKPVYTEEQVVAMGAEARKLAADAREQLNESVAQLKDDLLRAPISNGPRNALIQECDLITLQWVTASDANAFDRAEVLVRYDVPDALFAFLRDHAKKMPTELTTLRTWLDGGVVMSDKATAEDPMPKTGKTKAGARGA